MHLLEFLFGFSPDGGNGSSEIAIFALLLTFLFLALIWKKKASKATNRPAA
ncbi:MAG TPA: hypothetical protein VMU05_18015 [Dongiaceae bacterium]|nr:hypothetical protein [Dongiaceae bacterium]